MAQVSICSMKTYRTATTEASDREKLISMLDRYTVWFSTEMLGSFRKILTESKNKHGRISNHTCIGGYKCIEVVTAKQ